ncbi:MAG TPA: outer membrane lipoprotein chaperone LolA [Gammaproteobacteria bacterium]|nr:outer membrane lipoprotein chaperone LolA [Gammaproteobacteria bacterium]
MKRAIDLCIGVLLAVAAGAAPAGQTAGIERVQRHLDGIDTLRARFVQTIEDANGDAVQSSAGVLTIARPNRFRWDYTEPYEQLVLADGERLWLYDADLEQVTVRKLDDSLASTPAMLLSGGGQVADSFAAGEVTVQGERCSIELLPVKKDTDFQSVTVEFEGEHLTSMTLRDALDQTTRIDFSAIERNPELAADEFAFTPPDGVDVIGATEP